MLLGFLKHQPEKEEEMEKSCLMCESYDPERSSKGRYHCMVAHYTWNHDCGLEHDCGEGGYEPKKEEPKKMDKQTAIINHRHMWGWLSENPEYGKFGYFEIFPQYKGIQSSCFLCEYAFKHTSRDAFCDTGKECLLKWPTASCESPNSIYDSWRNETNPSRRAELARQIRDLPEREEKPNIFFAVDPAHSDLQSAFTQFTAAPKPYKTPPPPPKLTRTEAIAKTREQWLWLGQHPKLEKLDYFKEKGVDKRPAYGCYLCEWTGKNTDAEIPSRECGVECPLTWPGGWCESQDGLHTMWCKAVYKGNRRLRASIAYLIARLPEA